MTVLNGDGLVGRVTTVGPDTATVLLANDPDFTVGTRMEKTDELGFATGRGDNALSVQLLNGKAEVKKGDRLVTFGSSKDKPFVPGVPVGEVIKVDPSGGDLTRTVQVRPFVGFTKLDIVGVVVQPPREDPATRCCRSSPEAEAQAQRTDAPTVDASRTSRDRPTPRATAGRRARQELTDARQPDAARGRPRRRRPRHPGHRARPAPTARRRPRPAAAHRARPRPGLRPLGGALIGFGAGLLADLAPPADHAVGRYALVLCVIGYVAGLTRPENGQHRSATVPMLVVAGAALGSTLLYAGVGALVGDTAARQVGLLRLLFTATVYDLLLAPFTVPLVMALARRTENDPLAADGSGSRLARAAYGWLASGHRASSRQPAAAASAPGGRPRGRPPGRQPHQGGQALERRPLRAAGDRDHRGRDRTIKGVKRCEQHSGDRAGPRGSPSGSSSSRSSSSRSCSPSAAGSGTSRSATATSTPNEAAGNHVQQVVQPAVRGSILDARGVPLADNETRLVVSAGRTELMKMKDDGEGRPHPAGRRPGHEAQGRPGQGPALRRQDPAALLERLALPADPGHRRGHHPAGPPDP